MISTITLVIRSGSRSSFLNIFHTKTEKKPEQRVDWKTPDLGTCKTTPLVLRSESQKNFL